MLPERFFAIDYLQTIIAVEGGIYIKSDMLKEDIDYEVYKNPFNRNTWIAALLLSLFTTAFIIISWKSQKNTKFSLVFMIKVLTASLKANLGNDTFSLLRTELESFKVISFSALLFGNILWLTYNGALLSALVTPKVTKPFNDLESFSKSSYRLNTYIKGSAPASFWMQSPPNSIFKTIFEQNMDDSSFNTYKESMAKTIDEPNEAFYGSFMNIQQEKMDCKLELVVPMDVGKLSFGVKKGFPFSSFLNSEITKLKKSGVLKHMVDQQEYGNIFCSEKEDLGKNVQITIQKVIFPFCIILFGILVSLILLALEIMK